MSIKGPEISGICIYAGMTIYVMDYKKGRLNGQNSTILIFSKGKELRDPVPKFPKQAEHLKQGTRLCRTVPVLSNQ